MTARKTDSTKARAVSARGKRLSKYDLTKYSLAKHDLAKLVAEVTAETYGGEPEQVVAWLTCIEARLALPFETRIFGVRVMVEKLDLTERGEIIALCRRGRERQAIPLPYLPLPERPPQGWAWIEAYRYWAGAWR